MCLCRCHHQDSKASCPKTLNNLCPQRSARSSWPEPEAICCELGSDTFQGRRLDCGPAQGCSNGKDSLTSQGVPAWGWALCVSCLLGFQGFKHSLIVAHSVGPWWKKRHIHIAGCAILCRSTMVCPDPWYFPHTAAVPWGFFMPGTRISASPLW